MTDILYREFVYVSYYFEIQLRQIFFWYVFGIIVGSAISVFMNIVLASILGIASPICMYGTIPIESSLSKGGIKDSSLSAFMMSSIPLNPQLIAYSFALGGTLVAIRIVSCTICGIIAGFLVKLYKKSFLTFQSMEEMTSRDTDPNIVLRLIKNIGRNIKATGPYFLIGILLSALFQRYVPSDLVERLFGENEGFGILLAATIGVPLYACGGGAIPLLQAWLSDGMSLGSASAFMITGPATKITNLGALKIVLKGRCFALYIVFIILYSLISGILIDLIS